MLPNVSKRTLVIAGGVILLVLLLTVPFMLPKKQTANKTSEKKIAYDETTSRVFIKDFYTYGDYFTPQKQTAVQTSLYTYASQALKVPDLYTGVIRKGSFSQTKDSRGTLITSMLIDVNPGKVTYVIQTSGTTKDGANPVVIQCAPKNQQQDPSVTCMDGMQNRE